MVVRISRYWLLKNFSVLLLLASWMVSLYGAEIINCRCSHPINRNNTNNSTAFSSKFKPLPADSKTNNCCSHKTKHKSKPTKCDGSCGCFLTKAIANSKDAVIEKNTSTTTNNKDIYESTFNSTYSLDNTEFQNNSDPPTKFLPNKIFITFSSLRI